MENLKEYLLECGASLVGFADVTDLSSEMAHDLPRAVSIALALPPEPVVQLLRKGNRPARPDTATYAALSCLGELAAAALRDAGFRAEVLHATRDPLDTHKLIAVRAGIAWIGKCSLAVSWEYGSTIRLVTVLTDADLPADEPVTRSFCGTCMVCTEGCPAHAPSGRRWEPDSAVSDFFDANACRSYREQLAQEKRSCMLCMGICPFTTAYLIHAGHDPSNLTPTPAYQRHD